MNRWDLGPMATLLSDKPISCQLLAFLPINASVKLIEALISVQGLVPWPARRLSCCTWVKVGNTTNINKQPPESPEIAVGKSKNCSTKQMLVGQHFFEHSQSGRLTTRVRNPKASKWVVLLFFKPDIEIPTMMVLLNAFEPSWPPSAQVAQKESLLKLCGNKSPEWDGKVPSTRQESSRLGPGIF